MPINAPTVTDNGADVRVLASHAARTASGQGAAVEMKARARWLVFELCVTALGAGGGDTLDVYLQQSWDGSNWDDVAHFPQLNGVNPAQVLMAAFPIGKTDYALVPEQHAWTDGTLGAGLSRETVLCRRFRVRWDVAGGAPSFTFSVLMFARD